MAEETTDCLIRNLIVEDLNLNETQFEITRECSILDGSAVCIVRFDAVCLEYDLITARILQVHRSWLKAAQQGKTLPVESPKLSSSHLHWLMQPSCSNDRLPAGWHLVRLFCLTKRGISSRLVGHIDCLLTDQTHRDVPVQYSE